MNVVRTLHRAPNGHDVLWVGHRDRAIVLDIELLLRAGVVFTFDDQIRLRPDFIDIALVHQEGLEDVIFAPDDFLPGQRFCDGADRGQLFDYNPHVAAGFLQQISIGMGQKNYWLFRMVYYLVGEVRLIVQDQRHIVLARNVFRCNDREFIPGNVAFERDVLDFSVGHRAADSDSVQDIRERQVIDIQSLASDFPAAFFAGNRFADDAGGHAFTLLHKPTVAQNNFLAADERG